MVPIQGFQNIKGLQYAILSASFPLIFPYLYYAQVSWTNISYILFFYSILISILSVTTVEDWFNIINQFIPDNNSYIGPFRTLTYTIIFLFIVYFLVGYYNVYSDAYHIMSGNTIKSKITIRPIELEKIGLTKEDCDWTFRSWVKLKKEYDDQHIITLGNLTIKKKPKHSVLLVTIDGNNLASQPMVPELSELFYVSVVYHNQSNIINVYINGKIVLSDKLTQPHNWGKEKYIESIVNADGSFDMYEAVIQSRAVSAPKLNQYKKIYDRDPVNAMINSLLDLTRGNVDPPGKCKRVGSLLWSDTDTQ